MAYQTRTRSTRGDFGQGQHQPQVVYVQTTQNQPSNNHVENNSHVPSYDTTSKNFQMGQQQQQQMSFRPTPTGMHMQQQQVKMEVPPDPEPVKEENEEDFEDLNEEDEKGDEAENGRMKWLKRRRDPLFRVSKKVRRKRMNAKLRRLLQPKNAIMVLNELHENVKFTFLDQTSPQSFVVKVEVEGKTFTGCGQSKPAAKQDAAENALKVLLLEKMSSSAEIAGAGEDVTMKDESEGAVVSDVPPGEEPPLLDDEGKPVLKQSQPPPEDDVPWGSLASYALFKLFNNWQSQGMQLPAIKAGPVITTSDNRCPAPMKKLPDNPTDRHPVMLLNQLCPQLIFNDVSMEGVAPNIIFTVSVTIDGANYQGMGKNKKDAKKEAAKTALSTLYNIHYEA